MLEYHQLKKYIDCILYNQTYLLSSHFARKMSSCVLCSIATVRKPALGERWTNCKKCSHCTLDKSSVSMRRALTITPTSLVWEAKAPRHTPFRSLPRFR